MLRFLGGNSDCQAGDIQYGKQGFPLATNLLLKDTSQSDRIKFNESYQSVRGYVEENGYPG